MINNWQNLVCVALLSIPPKLSAERLRCGFGERTLCHRDFDGLGMGLSLGCVSCYENVKCEGL